MGMNNTKDISIATYKKMNIERRYTIRGHDHLNAIVIDVKGRRWEVLDIWNTGATIKLLAA